MTISRENKNIVATISIDILTGLATLLSAGALWQGLLLHYGLNSYEVGFLTSAASIVQAIAMFLNIYITDRVRSPIRTMLWCNLPVCKRLRKEKGISYYRFYPESTANRLGSWASGEECKL